ncbi:patatin-like phospholipase family protein [Mycoplana dimorpha]|uniref:Patatin-like phospholipase n=1 Tax=Mycoplana dimorpha TaxID=28320 RepID=A0A2T5BER9_MYCDI|nr:patatin-like phospholipase family protein [Mycoplana dimorpha]PTM97363.1 patatin-like phospholipase [Mycoplana dimorpha]
MAAQGENADHQHPSQECDLIMRGGITSGVVFPKAITRLATRYRFVNVGGTSAGSIAAIMAAAAEYRRASGGADKGFAAIDGMAGDLARNLRSLFQPWPATRSLFIIAMSVIASGGRLGPFFAGVIRAYWLSALIASLPGLALIARAIGQVNSWAGLFGLLLLLLIPAAALGVRLWNGVTKVLPAQDYGLCSGFNPHKDDVPAFTNWIADKLDEVSGRNPADPGYTPLTTGDLESKGIKVASVTTDLSSGRPYQLPLGTGIFSFRRSEFEKLFPPQVVDHLVRAGGRLEVKGKLYVDAQKNSDYYRLPVGRDFPVLLVARLSLSFPVLISAVPLYRFDYTVRPGVLVRCLFSDGGITSNFPIHFFDSILPGRPTFGISLGSVDRRNPSATRVVLPRLARDGSATAAHAIHGLANFGSAILTTARNWQDNLQSRLHGYRERIVEIRLDDEKEGGLNLDMDEAVIQQLADLGDEAGNKVLVEFQFPEHRWRRAVTALPTLGAALERLGQVWGDGYRDLLLNYAPTSLKVSPGERRRLVEFADQLAVIGLELANKPLPRASNQRAIVRVVASIDTIDDP